MIVSRKNVLLYVLFGYFNYEVTKVLNVIRGQNRLSKNRNVPHYLNPSYYYIYNLLSRRDTTHFPYLFLLIVTEVFTRLQSIKSNIHLLHEPGYIMPYVGNLIESKSCVCLNFSVEYEYRKHFQNILMWLSNVDAIVYVKCTLVSSVDKM
jgi:hypothetical protein